METRQSQLLAVFLAYVLTSKMRNLFILCVGNICRSPIAEGIFKKHFPDKTIWSAGLAALVGQPADHLSVNVAAEHGIDISAHRAHQATGLMCQAADLILVMEKSHKVELEKRFPLVRGKVFGIGDLGNFEVRDPYRQSREAFETAYLEIACGVLQWVPRIRQLA